MLAIVYYHYGSPDELAPTEVPKPEAGPGQVLVRVRATSINSWEWDLLTGKPFAFRIAGLLRPKFTIPGADVAGVVEAVGPGVTRFAVGDEVFGELSSVGWGAMAEYVAAPETRLVKMSPKMRFEEAAALPQAGVLALRAFEDGPTLTADSRVLINGGGGGAGTYAIQLAKSRGAHVTAVDSGRKQDVMRQAGADRVLNYETEDFTTCGEHFDLVVDMMLNRPVKHIARVLKPNGRLAVMGGSPRALLSLATLGRLQKHTMQLVIAEPTVPLLEELRVAYDAGILKPLIDRSFPLQQAAEAYRYFGAGQVRGKLVITVPE